MAIVAAGLTDTDTPAPGGRKLGLVQGRTLVAASPVAPLPPRMVERFVAATAKS